jgi:hypothetical protein
MAHHPLDIFCADIPPRRKDKAVLTDVIELGALAEAGDVPVLAGALVAAPSVVSDGYEPSLSTLVALGEALGTSLDVLATGSEPRIFRS